MPRSKHPAHRESSSRKKSSSRARTRSASGSRPASVLYIHGIGQTDRPSAVKLNWDKALFGGSRAGATRIAY